MTEEQLTKLAREIADNARPIIDTMNSDGWKKMQAIWEQLEMRWMQDLRKPDAQLVKSYGGDENARSRVQGMLDALDIIRFKTWQPLSQLEEVDKALSQLAEGGSYAGEE